MKQLAYLARTTGSMLMLALSLGQAWATNDPVNGKALYVDSTRDTNGGSCSGCHNSDPTRNQATITKNILTGSRNPAQILSFINSEPQMQGYIGVYSASELDDIATYLSAVPTSSPASPAFAAPTGGSGHLTLTISNTGGVYYKISSISLSGAQASEYAIVPGSSCLGAVLSGPQTKANATPSCTVDVTFTPSSAASHAASLDVAGSPTDVSGSTANTSTAAAASLSVPLTGSISGVTLSPNQVTLPYVAATASTAASWTPATATLTNNDTSAATINSITSGSTHVTLSSGAGYCQANQTLAVAASCTIGINADAAASTSIVISTSAGSQTLAVEVATPPSTNTSNAQGTTSTSATNAGGGGCTMAGPRADFDPLWLGIVFGAAGLSAWRHRPAKALRKAQHTASGQ